MRSGGTYFRALLRLYHEAASRSGMNVDVFEQLGSAVRQYHAQVLRVYGRTPFPGLLEALDLLQNCVVNMALDLMGNSWLPLFNKLLGQY